MTRRRKTRGEHVEILRSPLARWPFVVVAVAALATGQGLLAVVCAGVAIAAWSA